MKIIKLFNAGVLGDDLEVIVNEYIKNRNIISVQLGQDVDGDLVIAVLEEY